MIFVLTGSEDSGKAFRITTLYSLASQDSLVLLKASGHKENFYMLPDGKLYYTGMTDAVRHSVGLFAISPNGTSVEPVELYFTDYTDPLDTGSEYGWFRSYDGRVTSETSHEYDYMGEDFDPAIKADIIEFTPNEYCLFKDLRHRYEIVPDEVDPKDVEDLCRELGGHPLNINDRYEEQVINGLLKDEKYADKIFLIRDGVYVKVVKNEDGIALEESMEKTQGTGYICEFDY